MKPTPSHNPLERLNLSDAKHAKPRPVLVAVDGSTRSAVQKTPCASSTKSYWPEPSWLALLQRAERELVLQNVSIRSYQRGKQIHHNGASADCWTGIVAGLASLSTISQGGKSVWFSVARPGQWLGEDLLLDNRLYPYELVAIRETKVATISRPMFQRLFESSSEFSNYISRKMALNLSRLRASFEYERSLDATSKVARCIARLSESVDDAGENTLIDITQNEIGSLTGISRQVVNGALQQLADVGMLTVGHGGIRVKKAKLLGEYIHW